MTPPPRSTGRRSPAVLRAARSCYCLRCRAAYSARDVATDAAEAAILLIYDASTAFAGRPVPPANLRKMLNAVRRATPLAARSAAAFARLASSFAQPTPTCPAAHMLAADAIIASNGAAQLAELAASFGMIAESTFAKSAADVARRTAHALHARGAAVADRECAAIADRVDKAPGRYLRARGAALHARKAQR